MTGLPIRIAVRYLFARKSYNVINLISGIGVAGMALGTAALVIILSVFNGFNRIVSESISDVTPDIVVRPASGKVFEPDSLAFLIEDDDILVLSSTLEDQVFVSYEGRQSLARVKGVDMVGEEESAFRDHVVSGEWMLRKGDLPFAMAGVGLAQSLGLSPRFLTPMEIFYPSRTLAPSLANPAATLRKVSLRTGGLFSVNAEIDAKLLIVPIECMRELLEYPSAVSSLEIWTAPGTSTEVCDRLSAQLGDGFKVLDRYRQNESVFKMMRYEKLAIYLILLFVVIIIASNIFGSLSMLRIAKEQDMQTLRALGADERLIRRIFVLEGWLVNLCGLVAGLLIGVALALLQQHFGIVKMPGGFFLQAYPVVLRAADILWTVLGVGAVGFLISLLSAPRRQAG